MQISAKLGEEIKKIRTELKLDQKDFANLIGISNVHLSNLEKGKKLPSKDLLIRAYKTINQDVPEQVLSFFSEAKSDKKTTDNLSNDIIYNLQDQGLYSSQKLKELLKSEPDNTNYIFGLLNLFKEEGKIAEARQHLLESLVNIKRNEVKRWVESTYFLLEGNFKTAIDLMIKAIEEFEKDNSSMPDFKIKKAGLLFELASIYFEYGYHAYNYSGNNQLAIQCFSDSLETFKKQREIHTETKYEMYYANVFWWLAFLGVDSANNWQQYIDKAENVILLNHEAQMKKSSPAKLARGLYSQAYICQLIGGMAEAYAQLANLEFKTENKEKVNSLLKKGEFLLAQNSPLDISDEKREFYNFYFSYSCFYSIKAEIANKLNDQFEKYLDLCEKGLEMCIFSDNKNKAKQFVTDIRNAENKELKFYILNRSQDFEYIRQKVKDDE
ncbi:MAG: XRE family transcriptional regulator [Pedobacter sp.]|nr:MAG: XRE family transcriptional regulator [Pedobacter sp.]